MIKAVVLIILAAGALAILAWVASHGLRRAWKLRRFAEQRGGAFAEMDEFGVGQKLHRFEATTHELPGRAVRLPTDPGTLYLLDLMGGERSVTACLIEADDGTDFELTSRMPRPEAADFDALFALKPSGALSEASKDALVEAVSEHGWFVSAWRRQGNLLVRTESRKLRADEWEAFVALAESLAESSMSEGPADE